MRRLRCMHFAFTVLVAATLLLAHAACDLANPFDPPALAAGPPPDDAPPITIFSDLRYDSPGSTDYRLDLLLPPDGAPRRSVTILYVHGGSWREGDKSDAAPICAELARRGYSVVNMNYTLSTWTTPGFPQAMFDCKAVVRWIRTDGARQYALPTRIIAAGDSAGGHLVELLGTSAGVAELEPLPPPHGGYRVDGVVAFYAPADFVLHTVLGIDGFAAFEFIGALLDDQTLPRFLAASPLTYVTPDDPPMALFHGELDPVVPFIAAQRMVDAFTGMCRDCRLTLFPDATHGLEGFGGSQGVAGLIDRAIPGLLDDGALPDLNGDGLVNKLDVQEFAAILVDPDADVRDHPQCDPLRADFNHDGLIDAEDIPPLIARLAGP